jgi:hypothetical protein
MVLGGAKYYARASAWRAVHGTIPGPDLAADEAHWASTRPSIRAEMIELVKGIITACETQETESAAIQVIAESLASWLRPGLDAEYVARAVLAALARNLR